MRASKVLAQVLNSAKPVTIKHTVRMSANLKLKHVIIARGKDTFAQCAKPGYRKVLFNEVPAVLERRT